MMKRCLIIFLYLLLNLITSAQSPYFKDITLYKTGQSYSVSLIYQDTKGFVWINSSMGLSRFDGFENIQFGEKDSIDSSPVTALYDDGKNTIWIGHKNGKIERNKNGIITKFNPEEGLSNAEISFFHTDSKGTLWFGTKGEGVYYFTGTNRERLYNLNSDDGLNDNYMYCAVEDSSGNLYLGTDNGIGVININTKKVSNLISMKVGLPDNIVKHLEIQNNLLWIGMEEMGICTYNLKSKKFNTFNTWSFGTLTSFCMRHNQECWVSTLQQGLIKVCLIDNKIQAVKQYTTNNSLPSNNIGFIYCDRESNIWGGTPQGLFISASSGFEFINKASEKYDFGNTFSFVDDKHGNYWAATEKGLIKISVDASGIFHYNQVFKQNAYLSNACVSLYSDINGYIWAGTYGYGVFRINPQTLQSTCYNINSGLSDNNILYITGNKSSIWMATAGGGAVQFDLKSEKFSTFNEKNGLASNYLYYVFNDSKGNVWFALDGQGVSVLKNGKIFNNIIPQKLDVGTVYSITESKDGNMWFNTADKGLLCKKDNEFTFFNSNNGLISNSLRGVLVDKEGNLILTSNEGIQLYVDNAADFETFGEERGLAFLEPSLNGISVDNSGNVFIATKNGIIKYTPGQLLQNDIKPAICLSQKLLFFNPIEEDRTIFGYDKNHFTFEYNGLWYQAPENIVYRYKLDNYDYDWSRRTKAHSITYSNLPPGTYTFRVEVSNKPGVWIGDPNATYSFKIRPPFYKTWWFISLCVLAIAFSIVYYIKAHTAKLLKDKEILELEVKKRTATIQLQKEEIESQRDEIEAQRDFVIKQRDQISQQNEHIKSGIQYASRIQRALLPTCDDFQLHISEIFILNRPMDIVSGDFYWITQKENRSIIVAADCTGHGVSGAFMSVLGITSLTKIINAFPNISPDEILNQLRDEVKIALKQKGASGDVQDGMDIAVVIIENDKLHYSFAGANNPLYIIRNQEIIITKSDKMPIGVFVQERPFTNFTGVFEKGDMVYIFSDGYQDQLGGENERKFKSKPFQDLLLQIAGLPLVEQREILNNTMDNWKNGLSQNDDILILGFRI